MLLYIPSYNCLQLYCCLSLRETRSWIKLTIYIAESNDSEVYLLLFFLMVFTPEKK